MASSEGGIFRRLARDLMRSLANAAADRTDQAAAEVRDATRGGRYTCSCGMHTNSRLLWNSHKCLERAGQWTGRAAREVRRRMGKAQDEARRQALRALEAARLREWRTVPVRDKDGSQRTRKDGKPMTREVPAGTARGRSRPQVGGRVRVSDLRRLHRHHRDHERADRLDERAVRHEARGRTGRAERSRAKAASRRSRWTESQPAPRPAPQPAGSGTRPAPAAARPAPQPHGNGARPAPAPALGPRQAPVRPGGRLAPTRTRI
jgi:hypothetical protein